MDSIINGFAFFAGALSILMMVGVSADVVGRYFLNKPIIGMVEVNQLMVLWIVFLGAAWLTRIDGHINMDIMLLLVGRRARIVINVFISLICAAASLVLFWYSILTMVSLFQSGTLEPGYLAVNVGYILIPIPLGCLPMAIAFLRKAYRLALELRVPSNATQRPEFTTEKAGGK